MKLQSRMLLWIGGPFIAIFIVMAAFSYREASTMIESATQREMRALAEYHAEQINAVVERQRGILEGLGQMWSTELHCAKGGVRPDHTSVVQNRNPA